MIRIGPSGIGGANEAEINLESFSKKGLKAAEIDFTYSVYMNKEQALKIGEKASKLGIALSIHAPYFINLNSEDKVKREASKKRILKCCEIGSFLRVKKVVFHAGFYGKMKKGEEERGKEKAFENIKEAILEMQKEIKAKKWAVELAPELMGKRNVFGSIDEISRLVKETGCSFCIDFAHVLARYGEHKFEELKSAFPQEKWQCHFSGIVYGENGERHHRDIKKEEWKELFENLPKNKEINIICESPDRIRDAEEGLMLMR